MGDSEESADSQAELIEQLQLANGRTLVVRAATAHDAAAVHALYGRLSDDDLDKRFFHAHMPPTGTTFHWVTVAERGGLALIVEVTEPDGSHQIIAEAGYALLENGDGELGITVDPGWRGWLGPWLLDVLVEQAALRDVANLHADVLLSNEAMRALLEHRGHAVVDHPDWHQIRLVIGTHDRTPSWPPFGDEPHLLVVAQSGRWSGEAKAQEAGFDVRTCPGPSETSCPVAKGQRCPLLDGADAVIFDLATDLARASGLTDALEQASIPVVYSRRTDVETDVEPGAVPSACERANRALAHVVAALRADDEPH